MASKEMLIAIASLTLVAVAGYSLFVWLMQQDETRRAQTMLHVVRERFAVAAATKDPPKVFASSDMDYLKGFITSSYTPPPKPEDPSPEKDACSTIALPVPSPTNR